MSVTLDNIQFNKPHTPIVCLFGETGMGKTSLASTFPNPIFIDYEGGLSSATKEVPTFGRFTTYHETLEAINVLLKEKHDYKTLVVDSITELNRCIEKEIVAAEPRVKSLNNVAGGYGAGVRIVADWHRRLMKGFQMLQQKKGMNIVLLFHCEIQTVDNLPDYDTFSRYVLTLHQKSAEIYEQGSDLIGLIQHDMFIHKEKAESEGGRVLVITSHPQGKFKNRYGITTNPTFKYGENPLLELLPTLNK